MTTVLLAIAIFALAAIGLGAGVLWGRAPIQGSCGGVACRKDLGIDCAGGCTKADGHEGGGNEGAGYG